MNQEFEKLLHLTTEVEHLKKVVQDDLIHPHGLI